MVRQLTGVIADSMRQAILSGAAVRMTVASDCMRPSLRCGDDITAVGCGTDDLRRGHIVVYEREGVLYAHRLIKMSEKDSDSVFTVVEEIRRGPGHEVSSRMILGRVIRVTRGEKSRDFLRLRWRVLNRIIGETLFARHVLCRALSPGKRFVAQVLPGTTRQ